MNDIAHLGPVELFTPAGEESLRFFVDVMGMEIEHQEGAATYLRGWGDYQPWSLKLIASDTSGMGVLGLRAWSPEALERRVAAVEAAGLGEGWVDGDRGTFHRNLTAAGYPCTPFYPHTLYGNPLYRGRHNCRVMPCPNSEARITDAFWIPHRALLGDEAETESLSSAIRTAASA